MATTADKLRWVKQRIGTLENLIHKAMCFNDSRDKRIESIEKFYVSHIEDLIKAELELNMLRKFIPHPDDPEGEHESIFIENVKEEFKYNKRALFNYSELIRNSNNANLNKMNIFKHQNIMRFYSSDYGQNFIFLLEGTGVNTQI